MVGQQLFEIGSKVPTIFHDILLQSISISCFNRRHRSGRYAFTFLLLCVSVVLCSRHYPTRCLLAVTYEIHTTRMAAGRKAPPWRRRKGGARERRGVHAGLAQQIWFAASPLLLLVIGRLSCLNFGVAVVGARAVGVAGDWGGGWRGFGGLGGFGGGSFALRGTPVDDDTFRQGEAPFWSDSGDPAPGSHCYTKEVSHNLAWKQQGRVQCSSRTKKDEPPLSLVVTL